MNVLLDECVPWPMHKLLPAHVCTTAQRSGWGGIKNGDLLRLAEGKFDLFITSDQNIRYQQNLAGRKIALVVLTGTTKWSRVRLHFQRIAAVVDAAKPGSYAKIEIPFS